MRFLKTIVAALAGATTLAAPTLAAETLLIEAGSVITDADSEATGPMTIIVIDGRIENIVPRDSEAAASYAVQGSRVIDLSDKTVLPGLIDMHTHL